MPDWKAFLKARLSELSSDPSTDEAIKEEIAQHLSDQYSQAIASGLSTDQAFERVVRSLGDGHSLARAIRAAHRPPSSMPVPPPSTRSGMLIDLGRDLAYSVRLLGRHPGFSLTAVVTLALGIGISTAIFTTVYAVLLRPLPYPQPDRLVAIGQGSDPLTAGTAGFETLEDWRAQSTALGGLAPVAAWRPTLTGEGDAEPLPAMRVSWRFFRLLGVAPALGRAFLPEEDRPAGQKVVVLSDQLWRRRFGADPGIVGRAIRLNDELFTVVGVLPAAYQPLVSEQFYGRADLYAPLGYERTLSYACRSCQHLRSIGRLAEGVTLEEARAELNTIQDRLRAQFPEYGDDRVAVQGLDDVLARPVRPALVAISMAVGLLLLIACANVANLMLARGTVRQREIALRTAIGASRSRLVRQLLVESLVLAGAGGLVGTALAWWGVKALVALAPATTPRLNQIALDGQVLGFAALVSVGTGLLFGLLPALRVSWPELSTVLRQDRRTTAGGAGAAQQLLVVGEVALALILLAGAGLMVRTLSQLLSVDPGFEPRGVLTLKVSLTGERFREAPQTLAAVDEILARIRGLPGIEAAAAAGQIPLGGNYDSWGFHIEGRMAANPAQDPPVQRYSVTPGYFEVMGIPLHQGRAITAQDTAASQPVMVVGQTTAERLWAGDSPIGSRVRIGPPDRGPWRTVVGVVGDVQHVELHAPPMMQMYVPETQVTDSFLTLVVNATGDPTRLAPSVREQIRAVDADIPVYDVAALEDLVADSVATRRFVMLLLSTFAGLAVVLASVGIYGVVSYTVAQRTKELGVRIALGAQRLDVARLVLRSGTVAIGGGLVLGAGLASLLTRILQEILFGVEPGDPLTLLAGVLVLVLVAAAAYWVPVRRALRVDPVIALRAE